MTTAQDVPLGSRRLTRKVKVHPLVWAHAVRIAAGDLRRIEIHSESSVTVHNQEARRDRQREQVEHEDGASGAHIPGR